MTQLPKFDGVTPPLSDSPMSPLISESPPPPPPPHLPPTTPFPPQTPEPGAPLMFPTNLNTLPRNFRLTTPLQSSDSLYAPTPQFFSVSRPQLIPSPSALFGGSSPSFFHIHVIDEDLFFFALIRFSFSLPVFSLFVFFSSANQSLWTFVL